MTWEPIETAPQDGSSVILFDGSYWPMAAVREGKWDRTEGRWRFFCCEEESCDPTHWMPMPEPPQPAQQDHPTMVSDGAKEGEEP